MEGRWACTVMIATELDKFVFYTVEDGGKCVEGRGLRRVCGAEVDGVFCCHCGYCCDCVIVLLGIQGK
jgi:hypothetical protein